MKKRKTFTFDSRTAQAVEMASKKYLSKSVKSYLRELSEVIE